MDCDPPSDLTFGIELEFLLISPIGNGKQRAGVDLVWEALSAPFAFECPGRDGYHEYSLVMKHGVYEDDDDDDEDDPLSRYNGWDVVDESTVKLSDAERAVLPQGYMATAIEVRSGIFQFLDLYEETAAEHVHDFPFGSLSWVHQIELVLERLQETFNNPFADPNMRLIVNNSCAFHVHVGHGLGGFPAQTVARVLGLFTACERQVDSIMPRSRISGCGGHFDRMTAGSSTEVGPSSDASESAEDNFHCLPLSYMHISNAEYAQQAYPRMQWVGSFAEAGMPDYPAILSETDETLKIAMTALDQESWLYILSQAHSISDLHCLNSGFEGHRGALNILGLTDYYYPTDVKRTIEFRQHAGTLDFAEIRAWIDLVLSACTTCQRATAAKFFYPVVLAAGQNPNYTILDLAHESGATKRTVDTFAHMISREEPTYARTVYQRQTEAERNARGDVPRGRLGLLSPVVLVAAEANAAAKDVANVETAIRRKLLDGGYGYLPRPVVVALLGRREAMSKRGRRVTLLEDIERISEDLDASMLEVEEEEFEDSRFSEAEESEADQLAEEQEGYGEDRLAEEDDERDVDEEREEYYDDEDYDEEQDYDREAARGEGQRGLGSSFDPVEQISQGVADVSLDIVMS